MAAYIFLNKVMANKPISVFNNGDMMRDFTYVDDIVKGILAVAGGPPSGDGAPHRVYNIGNNNSTATILTKIDLKFIFTHIFSF